MAEGRMVRREFVKYVAATTAALGLAGLSYCLFRSQALGTLECFNHSNSQQSKWVLHVDGFVQRPLSLALEEIVAMPSSTVSASLYCLPSPRASSGILDDEGNWTGVRLGLVLERAGVSPDAVKVAFYAEDDFSTDLTVTAAMREDVILAYEKDGEPLPQRLRLIVPGKWGYKWIHSIVHIELVDYDFKGTYESRGFPDDATIPLRETALEDD